MNLSNNNLQLIKYPMLSLSQHKYQSSYLRYRPWQTTFNSTIKSHKTLKHISYIYTFTNKLSLFQLQLEKTPLLISTQIG